MEKTYKIGLECFANRDYIKAIECFSTAKTGFNMSGDQKWFELAQRDLGRAYIKLNRFEDAEKIFYNLWENTSDQRMKDYAISRLGIINAELDNYSVALDLYKKLPKTIDNLINTAMMYYHIAYFEKIDYRLETAERILLDLEKKKSR